MNTATGSAGGYLVPDLLFRAEIDWEVFAQPVFLSLCSTVPVTQRKVRMSKVLGTPSLGWVAESQAKPVTSMSFGKDDMEVKELAGLLTWSDRLEAESISQPGIRGLITQAIADAAGAQVDGALFASQP